MINLVILHHRSTGKTARVLAELLGLDRTKVPTTEDAVVIRWGSSRPAPIDYSINSAHSIAVTSNGLQSLQELASSGIPIPELFTKVPDNPGVYPILGRLINHRGGKDIVWCKTPDEARNSNRRFFTRYTPVTEEMRFHVFGGKVLRVFRKVKRTNDADNIIRTSYRGWGYARLQTSAYSDGHEIALDAVRSLGLVFGGVDMGYNSETGKYVVFEVNTGPSLNSISALFYAREFECYLVNRQEFNYEPPGVCWADEIKRRIGGSNGA